MKKNRGLEFTLMLLYVCLGSFGVLSSVVGAFDIPYEKNTLYLAMLVFCIVGTVVLYAVKKYRIVAAVIAWILGESVLFLVSGNKVFQGVKGVGAIIRKRMKAYLNSEDAGNIFITRAQTEGLIFLGMILAAIIIYGVVCCKHAWCIIITMGVGSVIPFLVGEVPKNYDLICMGIVIFGSGFSKMGGAKELSLPKAGFVGITAGILAVVMGMTTISKPLGVIFHESDSVQKKVTEFWNQAMKKRNGGDKGTGGVNGGELGKISEFEKDDSVHLKVSVSEEELPKETLYLQGYVGTEYTGRKWECASPKAFENWAAEHHYEEDQVRSLPYNMMSHTLNHVRNVLIENVKANPDYQYRPYISMYGDHYGDTYVKGWGEKKYDIWCYALEEWNRDSFEHIDDLKRMEKDYERFVKREYTDVSGNIRSAFESDVDQWVKSTKVDGMIEEVASLLARKTRYSTNPGKTPNDRDFAQYFYFTNKKGYCSHYATVATLMFRMKGIPARYVSGYVVEPDEFKKQSDGTYMAEVTGESAHAWAEVYVSGKGWMPAETTPGYVERTTSDNTSGVQDKEEIDIVTGQEKPTQGEDVVLPVEKDPENKSGTNQENLPGKKKNTKELKNIWVYSGLAIAVIGIAGVVIVRKRIRYKRRQRAKQESYNTKIQRMFYKIFGKLVSQKVILEETMLDETFVDRLCERYQNISKEDARQLLDIVYRANFDGKELERKDYQFCQRMLLMLEKEA